MHTTPRSPRLATLALAVLATLAVATPLLAQNNGKSRLPDIGSSAGEVLGPAQQSGVTPKFWNPQKWSPVRPKPVCTSSAMHRPPCSRTIA